MLQYSNPGLTKDVYIATSLSKEVMFLVALVCLFVCLFVANITQKVMNGLERNFKEGSWAVQGRTD